jgi:hypothetical protein
MPEFLTTPVADAPLSWGHVVISLILALVLGRLVAIIYNRTRPGEVTPSFPATLVLLSVLIAMVTQVIGNNVARAFSLVGALSIVRFRTVVRDTEDTAFVIFAVVIGMAAGTQNLPVALIGMAIVTLAAFWMKPRRVNGAFDSGVYILKVRVALAQDPHALIGPALDAHVADRRLVNIGTAKQGLALQASYEIRLRRGASASDLVKALNRVEGVHDVELVAADAAPNGGD